MAFSNFHVGRLQNAETFLSEFVTLIHNSHIGNPKAPWKPVQKGIVISTTSALNIKDVVLNDDKFIFLCMSRFTQDGLENLFSTVRFRNPVPPALEFKNALRIISLTQLLKGSKRGSYNIDPNVELPVATSESQSACGVEELHASTERIPIPSTSCNNGGLSLPEKMSLYNLAGFCVKRFLKLNKHCERCENYLTTKERPEIADLTEEKCYSINSLTFASIAVYNLLTIAEEVICNLGEDIVKSHSILPRLINETNHRSEHLDFPECHKAKYRVLHRYITTRVFSFLKEKKTKLKNKQKKSYASQAEGSRSMAMRERIKKDVKQKTQQT